MDLGFHFYRTQFHRGGTVGAALSQIHPHLGPLPQERLNLEAEKCPQEVHQGQPFLPQLLKALTQGLQLAEVLPGPSISPRGQGYGVATGNHREQSRNIIPQVKTLPPAPLH
jgi:hypothetical protein